MVQNPHFYRFPLALNALPACRGHCPGRSLHSVLNAAVASVSALCQQETVLIPGGMVVPMVIPPKFGSLPMTFYSLDFEWWGAFMGHPSLVERIHPSSTWYQPPKLTLSIFVWFRSCSWSGQGRILQWGKNVWVTAMKGSPVCKHRWEREGQRLESVNIKGSILGFVYQLNGDAVCLICPWLLGCLQEFFADLWHVRGWIVAIWESMSREKLYCSLKHPFTLL